MVKQIPIRLNLDNEDEAKAYEYLQSMDKTIYPSYTKVFTAAIINLFESNENRKSALETDSKPTFSFSESNLADTSAIAKAVKDEIRSALPELVASTLMQIMQLGGVATGQHQTQQEEEEVPQLSESAWSFLDSF